MHLKNKSTQIMSRMYIFFKLGTRVIPIYIHEQLRCVYSESLNVQNIVDNLHRKITSFSHELLNCDALVGMQFQTRSHRFHKKIF